MNKPPYTPCVLLIGDNTHLLKVLQDEFPRGFTTEWHITIEGAEEALFRQRWTVVVFCDWDLQGLPVHPLFLPASQLADTLVMWAPEGPRVEQYAMRDDVWGADNLGTPRFSLRPHFTTENEFCKTGVMPGALVQEILDEIDFRSYYEKQSRLIYTWERDASLGGCEQKWLALKDGEMVDSDESILRLQLRDPHLGKKGGHVFVYVDADCNVRGKPPQNPPGWF